ATGAQLVEHPAIAAGGVRRTGDEIAVEQRCRWNQGGADDSLGRWFYEEPAADGLVRQLAAIVAAFPPRLLWDRRVRADDDERSEAAAGMRPDVRSPCFDDDDDEHGVALRAACAALDDGGDPPSWRELAASMTRWPEYPDARKWQERRVGLIARLLTDFRAWARGGAPSALLAQSGLACRFSAPGSTWRIALAALEVNRGTGPDRMTGSALSQAEITPGTAGLGFARQDRTVRIRDVIEFQDSEGIYLSWRLECVHEQDGFSHVLDHREAAGLDDVVGGCFELFDQFTVERHNLSSQGQADQSVERFAVRLGFLPTILDSGEFVLVAPRFELSDRFTVPADLGDLLVYRIAAIDTLGNSSQVVEHLTYRRNLTAPPAPAEATVGYELDLGPSGVVREQVSIEVTPSREMPSWAGGPVRYELWARSLALGAGFLGIDARLDESAQRGERTVVEPRGLAFVGATTDRLVLAAAELERFAPGRAHELWVRAVSVEGSASRLVRCVHSAHL
ncbi:MAG TPA: hypothetical protein VGD80_42910, partial [Kofleriaceae bacterium]